HNGEGMSEYKFQIAEEKHMGQINLTNIQADLGTFGMDYPSFTFSYEDLVTAIKNKEVVVVILSEKVVGFAKFMKDLNNKFGYLHQISVSPEHQRKGLAQNLIREVFSLFRNQEIQKIGLTTAAETPWGKGLYTKLGFVIKSPLGVPEPLQSQIKIEFEQSPEEKIYMELDIKNAIT
ncbi:MAG: GNAT family N-acetyltransferase, partial [Pseudomonadota bacterium]